MRTSCRSFILFSAFHLATLGLRNYRSWDWTDPLIELNEVQTLAQKPCSLMEICHLEIGQKPGTLVTSMDVHLPQL